MTGVFLLWIFIILALFIAFRQLIFYFGRSYTAPIPPAVPGTIRVACVGDSITYGTLIRDRKRNCYPAQLQRMLGTKYSVRNFGVNGRTMQKTSDAPYWGHKNFLLSTGFNPGIVLIMLGTNDSKPVNWKGIDRYTHDCRAMLQHYRSLPSGPVVYLMTPPMPFPARNKFRFIYNMSRKNTDEMTRAIKLLGVQENIPVIDINAATADHPEYFPFDGIHANAAGAKIIARTVYEALLEHGDIS